MPTQLLIYKTAVPLTWARHGAWSVETGADHSFSREINSVPLMAVEFPEAATEYAIVFAGSGTELLPMLTLGLRASENLFLAPDARWDAKYLPAFIRRQEQVLAGAGRTLGREIPARLHPPLPLRVLPFRGPVRALRR